MKGMIIILIFLILYALGNIFVYLIKKESKTYNYLGAGLYFLIGIGVIFIAYKVNC